MMIWRGLCGVIFLCFVLGVYSLEWTYNTLHQTTVSVCSGQNMALDWDYILKDAETVHDIRWDFTSDDSQELIAISVQGDFEVTATFAGRVSHHGNASLVLNDVTSGDTGNYSVVVDVHRPDAETYRVFRYTVVVTVTDPPAGSTNRLTLQLQAAVYDITTDSYHVQLSCGVLVNLGVPPVDVTWQTPSGSQEISTSQYSGTFYLQLKNPVQGGNYSCQLSPLSPAAQCLAGDDPLLEKTTLYVDGVMVRLSMLEAKEEDLRTANKRLTNESKLLKEELNQTKTLLTTVTANIDATTSLTQLCNKSIVRVSFHVRKPSPASPSTGSRLRFSVVYTNEGNAYNSSSGEFTAPVNGDYVFLVTTSGYQTNGKSDFNLRVDGIGGYVARAFSHREGYYNPGTAHAVLYLRQGQQVWVESQNNGQFVDFSSFTGFLLNPDW